MFEIRPLNPETYAGKLFTMHFCSSAFLDLVPAESGFQLEEVPFSHPKTFSSNGVILGDPLDHPEAFGAFEDGILTGIVQGHIQNSQNCCHIDALCVFSDENRREGIGSALVERIEETALRHHVSHMSVCIQNCNFPAFCFYRQNGFHVSRIKRLFETDGVSQWPRIEIVLEKKLKTGEI